MIELFGLERLYSEVEIDTGPYFQIIIILQAGYDERECVSLCTSSVANSMMCTQKVV